MTLFFTDKNQTPDLISTISSFVFLALARSKLDLVALCCSEVLGKEVLQLGMYLH